MECKRCEKQLEGKQTSYCGINCSKLHLKSLYRKRNKDKINAKKRLYRKNGPRRRTREGLISIDKVPGNECRACNTIENLTVNHIIPLSAGGVDAVENLEILCGKCNTEEYHKIVKKALKFYYKYHKGLPIITIPYRANKPNSIEIVRYM